MGRYTSDDNKVVMLHESGTYASTSGAAVWIGQVTSNEITDEENYTAMRFIGTGSRTLQSWEQGNNLVNGTLSYRPQDARMVFLHIGSVVDTSGANSSHTATEILTGAKQTAFTSGIFNLPFSFTLEDSKSTYGTGANFIRTLNGCVPSVVTITATQGEPVSVELQYNAQALSFSSGATTAGATADTNRPFYWSDVTVTVSGNVLSTVREVTFEMNNNTEVPFYLNGSRVTAGPIQTNKQYTLSLSTDAYAPETKLMYSTLYKGNATFNAIFDLNGDSATTGSKHMRFILSGCKVTSASIPSPAEGLNPADFEIQAQNVSAQSWDRVVKYNPW